MSKEHYVRLVLPWPPTVNNYWIICNNRKVLSKKAREFQANVDELLKKEGFKPILDKLHVEMFAYAPDRRKRDLDNIVKPTFDALEKSKIFEDDNQIDYFSITREEKHQGGQLVVDIYTIGE